MSIPARITATVAIARAGNSGSSHDGSADISMGLHGRAYLIDFIDRQLPCSCAYQYSVVLSRHFFSFCFLLHLFACLQLRLRTHCVFVRVSTWQVRERQPAWRPGGADAFDFFLC
jgi:hypothetical protein